MIPENVGNIKQVQALINELNFDKLCFWEEVLVCGERVY